MALRSVEEQIQKALAEGAFDDLPGKGRPLNLEAYFQAPEHLRMGYSILKSGEFVPEEVQMFKDIDDLKTQLKSASDEEQKNHLRKQIREKTMNLTMLLERHRRAPRT